jgi:hypothetical protein
MEKHWVELAEELGKADKELVENVNASIDSLLTFVSFQLLSPSSHMLTGGCPQAGLLSAVQSAFAIATYPLLQPSSAVASSSLQPSQPKVSAVTMNVFVFSSLALALICASVGILRKTQLKQHLAWMSQRTDARAQIMERQSSYELNSRRMLWDSASHFSWGLTLSIGLFAVGIFVFLWTMSWVVALAVLLFACFTLCVLFSRDIPHIPGRCFTWVAEFLILQATALYNRLHPDDPFDAFDEFESKFFVDNQFRLLSHAIMSRTSGLTASGVDPNLGRLALSIIGLGRLPNDVLIWLSWHLKSAIMTGDSPGGVGLGCVFVILQAILQDRDLFKGSDIIPLSLWARVKGHLKLTKPVPQKRQLSSIPTSITSGHQWLNWAYPASRQLNAAEACLLADILSDHVASHLQVTEPLRGSASLTHPVPEEPLYSAFCLAWVLFQRVLGGPSDHKLRRAIALTGVRLQFSDLPSETRLTTVPNSDRSGHEHPAVSFVKWSDESLQENINSLLVYPDWSDANRTSQHTRAEEGEHLL